MKSPPKLETGCRARHSASGDRAFFVERNIENDDTVAILWTDMGCRQLI